MLRVVLMFLFFVVLFPARAAGATYSAVELGTLDPGASVVIRGLNDAGDIVGAGIIAEGLRAFLLNVAQLRNLFPDPRSDYSAAYGINKTGSIVGIRNGPTGVRGFLVMPGRAAAVLPPLTGDSASEAFAINALGEVVGRSSGRSGTRAVRWSASGVPQALDSVPSAGESTAFTVNDSGTAAGVSANRAVSWFGIAMQALGTLPGDDRSEALNINASGQIVGSSGEPAGRRAVLWERGMAPVNLGVLNGGAASRALSINDTGQVVGTSESLLGSRAVIWTRAAGLQDLNDLVSNLTGAVLTHAAAINNRGVIVAIGRDDTGQAIGADHDHHEHAVRVFLLVPNP